jgi:CheY-like chemotaxis protein/Tfp pilus assembly ATPase PilU
MKIPRAAGLPLISRLKIIANLDIADRLRPQDGRARVAINKKQVDLRVSTLPASQGEKVVIRILDTAQTVLALESLGLSDEETKSIQELLEHRDGIILVTGPTGSGKTTTLYSAIRYVQDEGVNIVTVEDPVEYRLSGIVQVQVHEKAGLTFSAALRSILRQDPDVVLVGEIRDLETAQIAIQASLTGHLVLSTLHTNDAAGAITRLGDLGVEAFKVATAMRGIVAQRLMRTLCLTCRELRSDPASSKLQKWIPEGTELYRAVGCPDCAMTGYRGRFSIIEVLKVTREIERHINAGAPASKITAIAKKDGMKTMWDSGLAHVLRGRSTIEELLRVVDMPWEETEEEEADSGASARSAEAAPPAAPQAPVSVEPTPVVEPPGGTRRVTAAFELIGALDSDGDEKAVAVEGIRVLLVDDEDHLRHVMKDLLERDGFDVLEAGDGAEAIQQVDKHTPDILVLDLNLPGLDGYGVITHLRSRPATEKIPIIVLTAKGDEDSEVRVFELGADDFLSKPFRARSLSARIQAVLSRTRE